MDDDEVTVETQPRHTREPLGVHDRVGRIAGPPAPVHPPNLLRGGAVGHGLPQLRARRPQALLIDALQLPLVRDGRSACASTEFVESAPAGEAYAGTEAHKGNTQPERAPSLTMHRTGRGAAGLRCFGAASAMGAPLLVLSQSPPMTAGRKSGGLGNLSTTSVQRDHGRIYSVEATDFRPAHSPIPLQMGLRKKGPKKSSRPVSAQQTLGQTHRAPARPRPRRLGSRSRWLAACLAGRRQTSLCASSSLDVQEPPPALGAPASNHRPPSPLSAGQQALSPIWGLEVSCQLWHCPFPIPDSGFALCYLLHQPGGRV